MALLKASRPSSPSSSSQQDGTISTSEIDASTPLTLPTPPSPSKFIHWPRGRPHIHRKKQVPPSSFPPPSGISTASGSPPRRASYAPAVPSPLNPASETPSLKSRQSAGGLSGESGEQPAISNANRNSSSDLLNRSSSGDALNQMRPDATPRRQRLEGRDYDRYPTTPRASIYGGSESSPPSKRNSRLLPTTITATTTTGPATSGPGLDSQDPEKGFSPYLDDSLSAQSPWSSGNFPMYMDDKEEDDELHNPDPEKDALADKFKTNTRGILSFTAFAILILGIVSIFIVLPVLTWTGYNGPKGPSRDPIFNSTIVPVESWAYVNSNLYPLLGNVRKALIDKDTPQSAYTRTAADGSTLKLVFSDEFNDEGRSFYEGDDPFWTAVDLHYAATGDLEWYDPDSATTAAGTLRIKLDAVQNQNHNLDYRSAMLQSWNKMCFQGGVLEVSASLAGPGGKAGLWPGIWTMGNLARPGYLATSDGVWPYSYNSCDAGITPNQSSTDGISFLPGQRLASCACPKSDHPNPGTGRGAPEIDALEGSASADLDLGVVTQSAQVAPYDVWYQPDYDFISIHNYSVTQMNTYTGGPFQQAISGVTTLNNKWYDGNAFQKYAFEYTPGVTNAGITWYVGDEKTFFMDSRATGPNGNVGQRTISQEPMSVVLNLGVSNSWTYIDWPALQFPATMYIDYVRIYQPAGAQSVTCDPPGFPTTDYISKHMNAYTNPNLTTWQAAGYSRPKNSLMDGC